MKKISAILSSIKNNLKLVAVGTASLVVGGLSPVLVRAAIPSSTDGQINACYKVSTGTLRVIDTEAGQTCSSGQENPISWPSQQDAGGSGAQTAFAYLNADGTLNTTTSKNIASISRIQTGIDDDGVSPIYTYCFDLAFDDPKWMSTLGASAITVRGAGDGAIIDNECGTQTQYDALARYVGGGTAMDVNRFAFFN